MDVPPVFILLSAVVGLFLLSQVHMTKVVSVGPQLSDTNSTPVDSARADIESRFLSAVNETTRELGDTGVADVTDAIETETSVTDKATHDHALTDSTAASNASGVLPGGHQNTPDYLALSPDAEEYRVSLRDCLENKSTIYGTEGLVLGLGGSNDSFRLSSGVEATCKWRIVVPKGRHVILAADVLGPQGPCVSSIQLRIYLPVPFPWWYEMACVNRVSRSPIFLMRSNTVEFSMVNRSSLGTGFETGLRRLMATEVQAAFPHFRVLFTSTAESLWIKMTSVFTSPISGFITSPGFDVTRPCVPNLDASYNLSVPGEHVVMVSFPYLDLDDVFNRRDFVQLTVVNPNGTLGELYNLTEANYISPLYVFHSAAIVIRFVSGRSQVWPSKGMNLSFSFHPVAAAPQRLGSGLWDCSVPDYYASFKQHVHCDLQPDCQGGEDEGGHCPFSSPDCRGSVDAGGKCFLSVDSNVHLSWEAAQTECHRRGGDLAMMKTPGEWEAFWKLYDYGRNWKCAYIGLRLNHTSLTRMYRKTWSWLDTTTAFDVSVTRLEKLSVTSSLRHSVVMVRGILSLAAFAPVHTPCSRFICQLGSNDSGRRQLTDFFQSSGDTSSSVVQSKGLQLVRCPAGHFTRTFLRCHAKSRCGVLEMQSRCPLTRAETSLSQGSSSTSSSSVIDEESVAMFECENQRTTLPYTLVCDFIHDCSDGSDEKFCEHEECLTFRCKNGQCLSDTQRCDDVMDCWDENDEASCQNTYRSNDVYDFIYHDKVRAPSTITFTSRGRYEQTPLSSAEDCPDTYFRCPSSIHCLPVYLRCNGKVDCPRREDEMGCDDYTCPGFYRCRGSSACVHVDQLCDGVAQCPWRDDELLCEATCPQHCRCQGLAFVCHQPFQADGFPQVRYLDASGSGMTLADLADNRYLVYVTLASSGLLNIARITLPNLWHLDLSKNAIDRISMDVFLSLKQLRTLNLMGNPLTLLTAVNSYERQLQLRLVDLSHTQMPVLSGDPFKSFFSLQSINISFSKVHTIAEEGFQSAPALNQLDLRGNSIKRYPPNVFKHLANIQYIYADDYKLCCPGMLPEGYETDFCFSPQNEISSCKDLLRSDLYRAFLWFMCTASIAGNVGCFFFRNLVLQSQLASGFGVFVSNLSVADCLMGVYLVFIGAADHTYRGSYYRYEDVWTASVPCRVSGFLSLLSSEVSAITICLITLDRFIVLRFPFSTLRFEKQSAAAACLLTWLLGISLAAVPLLVPHWRFYSQAGICIPLPVTRQDFAGRDYSFGVIIVFNFLLFLVIAAGQMFIFHSVRINTMAVNTTKKLQDLTVARRLITVAVSDFLCWFPIGVLGILAAAGIPVPGEVNVAIAIFVLPLNSALNPFIYTFNILMERQRKEKEARVLKWLEVTTERSTAARGTALSPASENTSAQDPVGDTKQEVLQCLHSALDCQLVSSQDVRGFLLSLQENAD